jgi:hypothetical protein
MGIGKTLNLPKLNYKISPEDKVFFSRYGHMLSMLRRKPTLVARVMHGIVVPPHERIIWRGVWQEFMETHLVGGRGTSKSAALAAMAMSIRAETRARRKYLSLSASKFRGGKIIMEEAHDFLVGRFKNQLLPAPFGQMMMRHRAGVKREADRWFIAYKTHSVLGTIPTGNHESARGFRANWLVLDEADNWDRMVIEKYFGPFLAVGGDFEDTASGSQGNAIFYTGTVSTVQTDWAQTLEDREKMLAKRYDAQRALLKGDYKTYRKLMDEDNGRLWNLSVMLQRWDYTDLIIPMVIRDPVTNEPKYEVHYPEYNRYTKEIEINPTRAIKYDRRDDQDYYYTYPFAKEKIESTLDDGLSDMDVWAAENRCMPIRLSGGTYPRSLLDKITDTELLEDSEAKSRGWDVENFGSYTAPLLYECSDPCVLGVDPARTDDFTAFVVIRLGTMCDPNTEYNPVTGEGYTQWNNVIWAEARRHTPIKDIAEKIRDLKQRYNLVVGKPENTYAVAMDARGAASGTTVQDELARPSPVVDDYGQVDPAWVQPQLIFDPTGKEYKHLKLKTDAWPGLRLIWSTDALNTELVSFSKGQMEQSKLYIAQYKSQSDRVDSDDKYIAGFAGVQSLKSQLAKMQSNPTKYHLTFFIPGDPRKLENKDDLFKAFLYAVAAMKSHLTDTTRKHKGTPTTAVTVVKKKDSDISRLYGGDSRWSTIKF